MTGNESGNAIESKESGTGTGNEIENKGSENATVIVTVKGNETFWIVVTARGTASCSIAGRSDLTVGTSQIDVSSVTIETGLQTSGSETGLLVALILEPFIFQHQAPFPIILHNLHQLLLRC